MTAPAGFVIVSVTRPPAGHPLSCSVNDEPRVPVFDGRTVTFGAGAAVGATVGTGVGATVGGAVGATVGAGVGGGGGATVGTGVTGVGVFVAVGPGSTSSTEVGVAGGGEAGATVAFGAVVTGAVVALPDAALDATGATAAGALGCARAASSSDVADATSQPASARAHTTSATDRGRSQPIPW